MAARSIATLSITFGLVSIPVKLYTATENSTALRFKLMGAGGGRLRQQYVAEPPQPADPPSAAPVPAHGVIEPAQPTAPAVPAQRQSAATVLDFPRQRETAEPVRAPSAVVVERSDMVKGYEFEKGSFVLFTPAELKALADSSRKTIDIVAFIPDSAVDPIYYDKAYFLTPEKRLDKPYSLLHRAMRESGRCALAKWASRSKEYVVQIRPAEGGLVLQQLLYADEVRSFKDLNVELADVSDTELQLAKMLIEQTSADTYRPTDFVDEEKLRILAAVERKIAGKEIVATGPTASPDSAQLFDLVAALKASLAPAGKSIPPRCRPARGRSGHPGAPLHQLPGSAFLERAIGLKSRFLGWLELSGQRRLVQAIDDPQLH